MKASRMEEINRTGEKRREEKKTTEKINETKSWFFNKIERASARLRKREKIKNLDQSRKNGEDSNS